MRILLRAFIVLLCGFGTALPALVLAPTRAADATILRQTERVPVTASERWALRPTRVPLAATLEAKRQKVIALSDLPDERRTVRVVYQGYSGAPEAR